VKGARFNANVKGVDASEFPAIDQVSDAPLVRVGADDLRQAIRDVEFAAAKDEGRPQLSGILLRARGHKLTLVGCDSYRLSLRTIELEAPATEDVDLIIPAKAMAEVARIQGALDEPIHIAVKPGRQILFHTSSVDIVSRLIDGAYVEFQRVIDQTSRHTVKATLATADLQRAARFTSFVSRDNNNALRIHVKPSGDDTGPGLVQLEATAKQVGENSTDLDAVVAGGAAEISLDNTYMTDALDAIHSQQLVLSATSGPSLPVLLHPVGTDGSLHIIMPMHLTQ
jgi:DNA polymerase-3 subunit beta